MLDCSQEAPKRKQEAAWSLRAVIVQPINHSVRLHPSQPFTAQERKLGPRGAVMGLMAHSCGGTASQTRCKGKGSLGGLGRQTATTLILWGGR